MPPPTRATYPHAKAAWFATAAHKVRAVNGSRKRGAVAPWGVVHGRQLGSARTACGVACLTWPIFFDIDVRYERSLEVCADCRRLALLDRP